MVAFGLEVSPVKSLPRRGERHRLERVRDGSDAAAEADNAVIVCSIENFDPMGIHTGDSITVAPAWAAHRQGIPASARRFAGDLTQDRRGDRRIKRPVRDRPAYRANDRDRDEPPCQPLEPLWRARPRGSPSPRSPPSSPSGSGSTRSATTSPERPPPASSQPSTTWSHKIPRWAFEKFPDADPILTTQMKSVGEVMAVPRTFHRASREQHEGWRSAGSRFGCDPKDTWGTPDQPKEDEIRAKLATPNAERAWSIRHAFLAGLSIDQINALTHIDPWFLQNLQPRRMGLLEGRLQSRREPRHRGDDAVPGGQA